MLNLFLNLPHSSHVIIINHSSEMSLIESVYIILYSYMLELRRCIENKIAELQKRLHEFLSFMNM